MPSILLLIQAKVRDIIIPLNNALSTLDPFPLPPISSHNASMSCTQPSRGHALSTSSPKNLAKCAEEARSLSTDAHAALLETTATLQLQDVRQAASY